MSETARVICNAAGVNLQGYSNPSLRGIWSTRPSPETADNKRDPNRIMPQDWHQTQLSNACKIDGAVSVLAHYLMREHALCKPETICYYGKANGAAVIHCSGRRVVYRARKIYDFADTVE